MADSSMTDQECQDAFSQEKARFSLLVVLSLLLTVASYVAVFCYKEKLLANPSRASRLYAIAAVIKVTIGVLLLTAFSPTCPSGCYCGTYHPSYIYPLIVIFVGVVWAARSKKFYALSQQDPTVEAPTRNEENELV